MNRKNHCDDFDEFGEWEDTYQPRHRRQEHERIRGHLPDDQPVSRGKKNQQRRRRANPHEFKDVE